MDEERLTILAGSFEEASIEFHRTKLSSKGYRMDGRITSQRFQYMDGYERKDLFDGKTMYAVTFVKDD
tara:strand:- start:176 stop:379 length:204 start_codon:yes stop_codon:yes gene_type:complete